MPHGRRKKKNGRCSAGKTTNLEQGLAPSLPATPQIECFNQKVVVTITDYRVRLADPDGVCEKFLIDAIVGCGILKDDSAKYIEKVIKNRPLKVKSIKEEKTVVEIEEVD